MKVYFVYEGEPSGKSILSSRCEREEYKVKITLPAKWIAGPCSQLLQYFLKTYNAKFGESKALVEEEMEMECCGVTLPLSDEVQKHVQEYNDIYIRHKVQVEGPAKRPEGSVLCTNFGCGKYFMPDDTAATCRHHRLGPVFHDTYKYWACCPEQKAMDWEEFENIVPCVEGPHGTTNKPVSFKSEAVTAQVLSAEQRQAIESGGSTATMYDGPKRTGPREFEGATQGHEMPQQVVDGKATCRNFGCQQPFVVAENHEEACCYHSEGPVFWDTYKYWKCCPQKKAAEFDDFVKIQGCTVGPHKL